MDRQENVCGISLADVLRHALDGVFVIDHNRRVVFFSEGCERITGTDHASVIGTSCACYQVTDCKDEQGRTLSGFLCPSVKIFSGEIPSYRQRMALRHHEGKRIWVETTYSPIRDTRGEVTAIVGIMRDITDVKAREEELVAPADADVAWTTSDSSVCAGEPCATNVASNGGTLDHVLTSLERREILAALERSNGQRTRAARSLGISRSRLYRRMDALGIDPHAVEHCGGV